VNGASLPIGRRVLVDGMMGSGKSTFARALAARTGLPVIHLDLHYWKPGWVRPSDDEWRERQRALVAGEHWIIDGNYNETLPLRLERAETVVYLDTPWWLCASRALARGLRRPGGEMPEGCVDSRNRRLRDEWGGVGRIWHHRRSDPKQARSEISRHGTHTTVHVLCSRREATEFLDAVCGY
jgi:adenylate kinase family enzyme